MEEDTRHVGRPTEGMGGGGGASTPSTPSRQNISNFAGVLPSKHQQQQHHQSYQPQHQHHQNYHHIHLPPSSPPASPPRRRQHSNSISESLAEGGSRYHTLEEQSEQLESSVLRAYPPPSKTRKFTPPQPRLVVPPSPPESFIAFGTRQYRSASTTTSATVRTMPAPSEKEEEEEMPVPVLTSLKGRLNKALNLGKSSGNLHRRQPSDVSPASAVTASPQTAPNSAGTNFSTNFSTAHTSFVSTKSNSRYFGGGGGEVAENGQKPVQKIESPVRHAANHGPGRHYSTEERQLGNDRIAREPMKYTLGRMSDVQPRSPAVGSSGGGDANRKVIIAGGEVRVEIKKPLSEVGRNNMQNMPSPGGGMYVVDREHGASSSAAEHGGVVNNLPEERRNLNNRKENAEVDVGASSGGLRRGNTRPQLLNTNGGLAVPLPPNPPARSLSYEGSHNSGEDSKTSDDYANETISFFEGMGIGLDESIVKGSKHALDTYNSSTSELQEMEPALHSSSVLAEDDPMRPQRSPSRNTMILIDSSEILSNRNSRSSAALDSQMSLPLRRSMQRSRTQSRSSSVPPLSGLRPALGGRSQTTTSIDFTSTTMGLEEVEEIVRRMSLDFGKRLSTLSSLSGGSLSSATGGREGGFGGGLAVVISASPEGADGGVNELRGRLLSISDEGEDDGHSVSREGGSSYVGDKGKGKEVVPNRDGSSMGTSQTSYSESSEGGESGEQVKQVNFQEGKKPVMRGRNPEERFLVHPGDDRYNYVYRVRSVSPDNQQILVPFYNTSQPASFPYRNALISSLPQKSQTSKTTPTKDQGSNMIGEVRPPPFISDSHEDYAGQISPAHLTEAFPRPAPGQPIMKPSVESLRSAGASPHKGLQVKRSEQSLTALVPPPPAATAPVEKLSKHQQKKLQKEQAKTANKPRKLTKKKPAQFLASADGAADNSTPRDSNTGQSAKSLNTILPEGDASVPGSHNNSTHSLDTQSTQSTVDSQTNMSTAMSEVGLQNTEVSTNVTVASNVAQVGDALENSGVEMSTLSTRAALATTMSLHSDDDLSYILSENPMELSSIPSTQAPQNAMVLSNAASGPSTANATKNTSTHRSAKLSRNASKAANNSATTTRSLDIQTSQVLSQYKEEARSGDQEMGITHPYSSTIASAPPQRTSHRGKNRSSRPRVLNRETYDMLMSINLDSITGGTSAQSAPRNRQTQRVFPIPPTLGRPPAYFGTTRKRKDKTKVHVYHRYTEEELQMQKRFSRVMFLVCLCFPPSLILMASGHLDPMMAWFTEGRVVNYRRAEVLVALVSAILIWASVIAFAAWGLAVVGSM